MDWTKPAIWSIGVGAMATAAVITASGYTDTCGKERGRCIPDDAHGMIAVSTSAASWSDTLAVIDNVPGELRQAPTPAVKFRQYRQYIASKLLPGQRPTIPPKST